jgi:hypothetical protein
MLTQGWRTDTFMGQRIYRYARCGRGVRRRKKITERNSIAYTIAQLAVETGIPPSEFIDMDTEMYLAIIQVLTDRAKEIKNASRGKRR